MSSAADPVLNTVVLPLTGPESRDQLWNKTSAAYRYVYEHHGDEYDWVLRADDDTYVIVENLRYMLYGRSPDEAVFFGCKFRTPHDVVFMSGGAGIVSSREAIRLLVERGLEGGECTDSMAGVDDLALGELESESGVIYTSKHSVAAIFRSMLQTAECYVRKLSGRDRRTEVLSVHARTARGAEFD